MSCTPFPSLGGAVQRPEDTHRRSVRMQARCHASRQLPAATLPSPQARCPGHCVQVLRRAYPGRPVVHSSQRACPSSKEASFPAPSPGGLRCRETPDGCDSKGSSVPPGRKRAAVGPSGARGRTGGRPLPFRAPWGSRWCPCSRVSAVSVRAGACTTLLNIRFSSRV